MSDLGALPGQMRSGWIEVIAGVMFSGKSEELIRRVRRAIIARKKVQVFKSHLDDRYNGALTVVSHDGRSVDAEPVDASLQIAQRISPLVDVVAIDEAQFLDAGIVELATVLAARGIRVIVAGTDTDFRGEPFGAMPQLMAVAEVVDKLHAICVICGGAASRNQRLLGGKPARYDSPTIMVGGHESYEARCRHCHQVPRRDEEQVPLL
ncbi:MAG TPA: thymidine kinase [Gemmatimonadaceae bacterium]|nr:thymidine kinase [Gemmatimonadaceae bacterium]